MAEPAFDLNTMGYDYYNDNAARKIKKEPQREAEIQPNLTKVTKKEPGQNEEARRATIVRFFAILMIPLAVTAIFGAGALFMMSSEFASSIHEQELEVEYNENHSELLRMQSVVENKITDSVIADYAESELGMIKTPKGNKVHSGLGTENGVIITE